MGDGMYEVGSAVEVRAFHVMPGAEGPEGEPHASSDVESGAGPIDESGSPRADTPA